MLKEEKGKEEIEGRGKEEMEGENSVLEERESEIWSNLIWLNRNMEGKRRGSGQDGKGTDQK